MRSAASLLVFAFLSPAVLDAGSASPQKPTVETGKYPYVLSLPPGAAFRKGSDAYSCPALDYKKIGATDVIGVEVVVKAPTWIMRTSKTVTLSGASGALKPAQWSGDIGASMKFALDLADTKEKTDIEVAFFNPQTLMKDKKEKFPESGRLSPWLKVPRR